MNRTEQRRHPRHPVQLAAVVADRRDTPTTSVVDLSEGGARLRWNLPADTRVGESVRLRFLLDAGQSIEIEGRVLRIADGHAGIEFLPAQQRLIRQLLAEAHSED